MTRISAHSHPLLPNVDSVIRALEGRPKGIDLTGLHGSAKAWVAAAIARTGDRPILIVQSTSEGSAVFFGDLAFWLAWAGNSARFPFHFPESETLPDEKTPGDPERIRKRLRVLASLSEGGRPVIVAPAEALIETLPRPGHLSGHTFRVRSGESRDREALILRLVESGYRRVDLVDQSGEFAVRGGLMDVFTPSMDDPVRMEWTGDTIDSIRAFDPETQLSSQDLREVTVLPPADASAASAEPDAARLSDYLPADTIWIICNPDGCAERLRHILSPEHPEGFDEQAEAILHPPGFSSFLSLHDLAPDIAPRMNSAGPPEFDFATRTSESLGLGLPGTPLGSALDILQKLRRRARVLVAAKSESQQNRLLELFGDHDLPAEKASPASPASPARDAAPASALLPFGVAVGELSCGFYSPGAELAVFTDEDLFGKSNQHRPPPRSRAERFVSSLEDLRESDFVVHQQHGIGRYEGIRRLTLNGLESDFLLIRYLDGDMLYVPVDHLHWVQKYVGAESRHPKLDRLGGITWAKTTRRVKKAVETIAKEYLDLYAEREICRGHGFPPDDQLTRDFDAAFEYEETPDQLRAIEDTSQDMERERPMDRLVCGDVGYGKTEVAMRAAFKAVKDSHQVAVLVPTTLLAHQHFQTFRQRFSSFPVRVAVLSRFTDPRERKEILKEIATGGVDILIGTHRILQKDVAFRKLGLLIVDEEQRFGVVHKEKLKQFRKSVDVLTLTATPIPRTLQMALAGIRDLSTIETPLPDRVAVRTILARFDPPVIRAAVLRELDRGGQVFFVHNRIEDIAEVGQYLKNLIPKIRIGVAHGRMRGRHLETVMMKFIRNEYDLLLSTAIIESGLDIPRANTILIHNAHRFGLSDLYQLRGRVGRSNRQGYAYLLVPSGRILTGEAKSRLSALQEFCELGAGFRIAAKDLEIRGAGHLLGRKQSGHVAAVGFEYFLRLIEKTVRNLKGVAEEEFLDPTVDMPVSAYIPEDYLTDVHRRLGVYRRLSDAVEESELSSLSAELADRYGPLPPPLLRLLEVVRIKILARELGIAKVGASQEGIRLTFSPRHKLTDSQIDHLLGASPGIRFLSEFGVLLPSEAGTWEEICARLRNTLKRLQRYDTSKVT